MLDEAEVTEGRSTELVRIEEHTKLLPVSVIKGQLNHLHDLMNEVLKKDEDYGTIPGTKKPTLYKAGAEKIMTVFRLNPQFEVQSRILEDDFILYDVKCVMWAINSKLQLGSGLGSCNSRKEKYMWRKAASKDEFESTEPSRRRLKARWGQGSSYNEQQVRTNPYDFLNTIEKMACKRALVAATLITTNASAIFTQDLEDLSSEDRLQAQEKSSIEGEQDAKKASEQMVKFLHVLCSKAGHKEQSDQHEFASYILETITGKKENIKSFKDLDFDLARNLIDKIQTELKKKEK